MRVVVICIENHPEKHCDCYADAQTQADAYDTDRSIELRLGYQSSSLRSTQPSKVTAGESTFVRALRKAVRQPSVPISSAHARLWLEQVKRSLVALVLCGLFDVVDDDSIDGAFAGLKLEAQLILDSCK